VKQVASQGFNCFDSIDQSVQHDRGPRRPNDGLERYGIDDQQQKEVVVVVLLFRYVCCLKQFVVER
jgi:hypothetical protein